MNTNIALNLRDSKEVEIKRAGVIIGGVRPYGDDGNKVEVYGFTSMEGPWGCGPFQGRDCVVHFQQKAEGSPLGNYHVEEDGLGVELTLTSFNLGRYSAVINLGWSGDLGFSVKGETEIGVLKGDSYRGRIWSRLITDGTLPYPHHGNPIVADAVQICGFDEMGKPTDTPQQEGNKSYLVKATFYEKPRKGDEMIKSELGFGADSVENALERLYSASEGIQTLLRAVDRRVPDGKVLDLVKRLETENGLRG